MTWIDDYPQSVDQVTLEQVNGAIKRYVDPRKLVMVKAGTIQGGAEPGP